MTRRFGLRHRPTGALVRPLPRSPLCLPHSRRPRHRTLRAEPRPWTAEDAADTYNLGEWSEGYFGVGDGGNVVVHPRGANAGGGDGAAGGYDLDAIVDACLDAGATLPLRLRFPSIVEDRIAKQTECFRRAMAKYRYEGSYQCAFPVKANHSRAVVGAVLAAHAREGHCCLEVGSKPELALALTALAGSNRTLSPHGPRLIW